MSTTMTTPHRAYDHLYDPVYTTPTTGLYNTSNPPVGAAAAQGNDVSGTGRHKYFRMPVVPHLSSLPPSLLLAKTAHSDPLDAVVSDDGSVTRSVAVQTKYRESESQTVPYTPEHGGDRDRPEPEVLLLQALSAEDLKTLQPTQLTMIELSRAKSRLANSLPPTTDEASLERRKRLMEVQEMKEFRARERGSSSSWWSSIRFRKSYTGPPSLFSSQTPLKLSFHLHTTFWHSFSPFRWTTNMIRLQ